MEGSLFLGMSSGAKPALTVRDAGAKYGLVPALVQGGRNLGVARLGEGARRSTAVMAWVDSHRSSHVQQVSSRADLEGLVKTESNRLLVLKCKAKGCRPCKAFAGKYAKIAESYPEVAFAEILGDESMETRGMMIEMEIKSTPTFMMYANGELVHRISGASKEKLIGAIQDVVHDELEDPMTSDLMGEGELQMKLQGA